MSPFFRVLHSARPRRHRRASARRGFVFAMGLGFGVLLGAPALAEPVITDEARRHFGAGVALLDDRDGPRYEEAYLAFRAAYAAAPSPKILGNLGLCAMMLERDGEAIDAYERYLREVEDIEPQEREQIERDLETLRASAARLTVEAPAGTTIVDRRQPVQGAPVVNRYGPIEGPTTLLIRPGAHAIRLEHEGRVKEIDFEARPGEAQRVRLEAETTVEAGVPTAAVIALAATGAVAIASFVTGGLALERQATFESANDGDDPRAAEAIRSEGEALNVTTDVLIASAAVGGAITTVLFFVLSRPPADPDATVRVLPIAGPLAGGAQLRIRF